MVLWQVDMGKKVPYSPNPDGFYYWTSVYYLDRADYSSDNALFTDASQCEFLTCLSIVIGTYGNVKHAPGRGGVASHIDRSHPTGGIPYDGNGYSMINVARVEWRSSTGRYSYKLVRQPLMASQMDGIHLVQVGVPSISAQMAGCLATAPLRNQYGERLTSYHVDPLLHMWQLRHGTERRQRDPIV